MQCRGILVAIVGLYSWSAYANSVVNVYSSRHYDVDEQIYEGFTKLTGIKVQQVQIKEAAQLIERVKAEGQKSQADVILTVDIGNLWRAEAAGILAAEKVEGAQKLMSSELQHPDGKWYAVSTRARVIVFNRDKVKPSEVSRYEDLSQPKWRKRVLIRSSNHVYNQSLVASLLHHGGAKLAQEWVDGIAANLARKPEGGDTDQIKAVSAGIGDAAIVNSYYVARLLKSGKPEDQAIMAKIGVMFPNASDRGAHINISGAAIAKHAPNRANGVKLIEYLLTDPVQQLFAAGNGEFPVTKVDLPEHLKKLGPYKADTASLAAIGQRTPEAVIIMDKSSWR